MNLTQDIQDFLLNQFDEKNSMLLLEILYECFQIKEIKVKLEENKMFVFVWFLIV